MAITNIKVVVSLLITNPCLTMFLVKCSQRLKSCDILVLSVTSKALINQRLSFVLYLQCVFFVNGEVNVSQLYTSICLPYIDTTFTDLCHGWILQVVHFYIDVDKEHKRRKT